MAGEFFASDKGAAVTAMAGLSCAAVTMGLVAADDGLVESPTIGGVMTGDFSVIGAAGGEAATIGVVATASSAFVGGFFSGRATRWSGPMAGYVARITAPAIIRFFQRSSIM